MKGEMNNELVEWVFNNTPDHTEEVERLLQQASAHDERLALDLDNAINGRVSDAILAAFLLGWQCRQEPERVLFAKVS